MALTASALTEGCESSARPSSIDTASGPPSAPSNSAALARTAEQESVDSVMAGASNRLSDVGAKDARAHSVPVLSPYEGPPGQLAKVSDLLVPSVRLRTPLKPLRRAQNVASIPYAARVREDHPGCHDICYATVLRVLWQGMRPRSHDSNGVISAIGGY